MNTKSDMFPLNCISDFIFVEHKIHMADIILVLGCEDLEVIIKAVDIYKERYASKLLVSGGFNKSIPEYDSEANYLSTAAQALGVPSQDIIMEVEATNTFENAKYSYDIIKKKQMKINSAIIVCRGFHSRRALLTYQRFFSEDIKLSCITLPGKKDITKQNWMYDKDKISIVMGEVAKIGEYFKTEVNHYIDNYK